MDPTTSWMGRSKTGPCWTCWILFPTFSIHKAPSPIFCQVDVAATRKQFATRFPDAARLVSTRREMEVRQMQFPALLEVVQLAFLLRHWICWYRFIPTSPLSTLHKVWPTCRCWQMLESAFHALRPVLRSDIHTLSRGKKSMMFGWCVCSKPNKASWKIPSVARRISTLPSGPRNLLAYGYAHTQDGHGSCIGSGPLATSLFNEMSTWNLSIWIYSCNVVHSSMYPKVLHDLAGNGMSVRAVLAAICAVLSATVPEKMRQNFYAGVWLKMPDTPIQWSSVVFANKHLHWAAEHCWLYIVYIYIYIHYTVLCNINLYCWHHFFLHLMSCISYTSKFI